MDLTGGAVLEIAKQVPALAVLVYLVVRFISTQQKRDEQLADTLDAVQTRSHEFGTDAIERTERINAELRQSLTENTKRVTACIEETNKVLGKATLVIDRHECFYEQHCKANTKEQK